MLRNVFVRLPTVAAVDALQALRLERGRPDTQATLRSALGPTPLAMLAALAVTAGLLDVVTSPWLTQLGLPDGAPGLGSVAMAAVLAWRLRGALSSPDTDHGSLRGALVTVAPALLLAATTAAAGRVVPHLQLDPTTLNAQLLEVAQHAIAQTAWIAALLVGWLSTRWWPLAPLEPVLVGFAAAWILRVALWFSGWGADFVPWIVDTFVSESLGALVPWMFVYADVALTLTVWGWVLAASWLVSGSLVAVGRRPSRIPVLDTLRFARSILWTEGRRP
ncbi:MAG: hypothetical protein KTR31_30830 [Myxococcales bacterium]|nr:hypothetical protein [Myxococcales bacterium]